MQISQNLPMMTITRSDQNKEDNTMAEREKNEKSTVRPMKRTRKKFALSVLTELNSLIIRM